MHSIQNYSESPPQEYHPHEGGGDEKHGAALATPREKSRRQKKNVVAHFFELGKKLGSGAFGDVYDGHDTRTGARVALKLEHVDAECPQLIYESRVMQELQSAPGIPRRYWFGKHDQHNVLIMQQLGTCLGSKDMAAPIDIPTALHIAKEALQRLQTIHTAGFAHRDIKPENFLFGTGSSKHTLYIIDFGLCKRVVNPTTGRHIEYRRGKQISGTPRYASLRMHDGEEQSRRDDLESLGYVLVFLVRGSLPWQGLSARDNYKAIGDVKRSTSVSELCFGLPPVFEALIMYARKLEFHSMPDYRFLLSLLVVT